jgi:threonine dehydrogenase-like Zn-dependent dehydrogenase
MLGARFAGEGKVEILDLPIPKPDPGEVLIKVAFNGLCGSERGAFRHGTPHPVGHEVSGTVVEVNDCDIAIGTRCVTYLPHHCGKCKFCQKGATNCCINRGPDVGWQAPWNGGYQQYMRVPANCVLPIDPSIGLDTAVLMLDTMGTAFHAVRLAKPEETFRALVVGCGPLGLGVVNGLVAFGIPEVFATDISETRLAAAAELGAHPVSTQDAANLKEIQVVIDVTGNSATPMQSIRTIEPQGRMVLLTEPGPWQYEPRAVSLRDYTMIRSWYFTVSEFFENQKMLLEGKVNPKLLISHVFPLAQLEEAYTLFASGKTRKVLSQAS